MPQRPSYKIYPGDQIQVVVVQPDGGRALVAGKLDRVPAAAGARALELVITNVTINVLRAAS